MRGVESSRTIGIEAKRKKRVSRGRNDMGPRSNRGTDSSRPRKASTKTEKKKIKENGKKSEKKPNYDTDLPTEVINRFLIQGP